MTVRPGQVHTLRCDLVHGPAGGTWTTTLHLPGRPDDVQNGSSAAGRGQVAGPGVSALGEVRPVEDGIELTAAVAAAAPRAAVLDRSTAAESTPGIRLAATVRPAPAPGIVTLRVGDGEGEDCELRPGDWSGWYIGRFATRDGTMRAACRLKLTAIDPASRSISLVQSQVYPVEGITSPEDLAADIVREIGPYFEHPAIRKLTTTADADTVLEEARYQALWHARVARYMLDRDRARNEAGWDLYQSHWHWPDTVSHGFLARYDPASPAYDPAQAEFATDLFRRTYQIADEMVGAFMEMADDDTYLFVVSDHGNAPDLWEANAMRRLEECGLVRGGSTDGKDHTADALDWANSKAYLYGTLQFCVNLKGREVHGSV
ncbi:MAG: alkaline phosphatase family protein, partial [Chloroflexota bacterium]